MPKLLENLWLAVDKLGPLLRNLNHSDKQLFEFLLTCLLGKKIDYDTRRAFEPERNFDELQELGEFLNFLENRCLMLENLTSTENTVTKTCPKSKPQPRITLLAPTHTPLNSTLYCLYCKENTHKIYTQSF